MRKLIFLVILTFAFVFVKAQTTVTTTSTMVNSEMGSLWGAGTGHIVETSDTTLQHVFRVKSDKPIDVNAMTTFTKVAGTITATYIAFDGSNDGTNYTLVDSCKLNANASAIKWKNLDDFNYSYLRMRCVGVGSGGRTRVQVNYSIRQE